MFSEEFMRYLINYQKPEYKEVDKSSTTTIPFKTSGHNKKPAAILLAIKK